MIATTDLGGLRAEADSDLLIRYQDLDDQAAFAELHSRYEKRLLAYLRRKGGLLRAEAEVIVQEAFMRFHKNRKTYPRKTSVYTLLHKIVTDVGCNCLEHAEAEKRDSRRTVHMDNDSIGNPTDQRHEPGCNCLPDPKADPTVRDTKIEVEERLARLPPDQAEAVRLTKIEGHSIESAGELLGLKPKTVHKRAERGINALRDQASDDNDND